MKRSNAIALIAIVFLAAILRFYKLGTVPVGFHRDEAFLGYNAYSILKTGKDITGNFLPIHLESFVWSPGGYSYAAMLPISLFGLNPFSVRFPAALFGTLTVALTYFLVLALFKNSKNNQLLAHASSSLLAISAWHINLSRTATENVLVVFFISLGILLAMRFIAAQRISHIVASFACFTISLSLYQAPRAFLPLFLPLLFFIFRDSLPRKSVVIGSICYLIFIITPISAVLSSPNLSLRLSTVNIFSTQETQLVIDEQIREDGVLGVTPKISRLYHNKIHAYSIQFLKNYFAHFSYDFLFTDRGLPERYRVPFVGLLHLFELPLYIVGFVIMLYGYKKSSHQVVLAWIFLGMIGTALTFDDVPNLQRSLIVFPALPIVAAAGMQSILVFFNRQKKILFTGGLAYAFCILYFFSYYLHQYYVNQINHWPLYRHEGYPELVKTVNELLPHYKKAVITNRETAPTIFFLFFGIYDPARFQKQTQNSPMRDFDRIAFDNLEFSQEECPFKEQDTVDQLTGAVSTSHNAEPDILYVNSGLCTMPKIFGDVLHEVKRPDSSVVFRVLALKKV